MGRATIPRIVADWLAADSTVAGLCKTVEAWPSRLSMARALWPALYVSVDTSQHTVATYTDGFDNRYTVVVDVLHGISDGPTTAAQAAVEALADAVVARLTSDSQWGDTAGTVDVAGNSIDVQWARSAWDEVADVNGPTGWLQLRITADVEADS